MGRREREGRNKRFFSSRETQCLAGCSELKLNVTFFFLIVVS